MEKAGIPILALFLFITATLVFLFIRTGQPLIFTFIVFFGILLLFILFFFRDPERKIPDGEGLIVSPADGRVVDVSETEDGYMGGRAKKVSIFLSVFDVHVNRIPAGGKIMLVKYFPGKFLAAWDHKASLENEQTHIGLDCGNFRLLVKQIAGLIARRVVWRVKEGDVCKRGDRFGLIKFGSRTDLLMPLEAEIKVKKGDKVNGGTSVVAALK
jgi:phosphatidylserine decarboxylase